GTIVLVQTDRGVQTIADGQQRIATTSILLCRIRDRLVHIKRQVSAKAIDNDFLRTIDRDTEATVPRIKLNLEDNDFFMRRILPSTADADYAASLNVKPNRASNGRLLTASNMADEFLTEVLATIPATGHADHLLRWVKFIEESAAVAVVIVPDEAGA